MSRKMNEGEERMRDYDDNCESKNVADSSEQSKYDYKKERLEFIPNVYNNHAQLCNIAN